MTTELRAVASTSRVRRHRFHWVIEMPKEVFVSRRKLVTASENPLTDEEKVIDFLCESMTPNASDVMAASEKPKKQCQ